MEEKISVCIPVYNGAQTIRETINSILSQTLKNFELVIVDNRSQDNTIKIIKSIKDKRIKLYVNKENIGFGGKGNLEECRKKARGDILFYLSANDIADKEALAKVYQAFQISKDIGIVTRPYFWFEKSISHPVRIKKQFAENLLVCIDDPFDKVREVIATSDQISGIAYRRKFMQDSFGQDYFVEMAEMFISTFKKYKAYVLKDNIVAVRIKNSGASDALAYQKSPLLNWYNLINREFKEKKYYQLKNYLIDNFVANNYIGLVQIKNYGTYFELFREIYLLLKLRWKNIYSLKFWFFSLGTIFLPRFVLRRLVVYYKTNINSKIINKINFNQSV